MSGKAKPKRLGSQKLKPFAGSERPRDSGRVKATANKFDASSKRKAARKTAPRTGTSSRARNKARVGTTTNQGQNVKFANQLNNNSSINQNKPKGLMRTFTSGLRKLKSQVGFGSMVKAEPHQPEQASSVVERASISVRALAQGFGKIKQPRTTATPSSRNSTAKVPVARNTVQSRRQSNKPANDRASVALLIKRFGVKNAPSTSVASPNIKSKMSPFRSSRKSPPRWVKQVAFNEVRFESDNQMAREKRVMEKIPTEIAKLLSSNSDTITSLDDLTDFLEKRSGR